MGRPRLEPGALWPALSRRTESALRSGALQPLVTRSEFVEDAGVRFVVRVLDSVERKRAAGRTQQDNPFLPYDEALHVGDVSDTHVALLNKFNVIEHHLLIVTRAFEDQNAHLTLDDFEALWTCMAGLDGLGFYNGGVVAGASQPHKHLQLVRLPFAPGDHAAPVEALFDGLGEDPGTVAGLPFPHVVARVERFVRGERRVLPQASLKLYDKMMQVLDAHDRPYNLLVTDRWMMLVTRSREHFESVSVNALGFAGSLFVRDARELELVKQAGPMQVLRHVCERS